MIIMIIKTMEETAPQSSKSGSVMPVEDRMEMVWKRGSIVTSAMLWAIPLSRILTVKVA